MTKDTKEPILVLYAPLSGHTVDLKEVPDLVFSQKLVGDGISIDPTSDILKAPCSGKVTNIHPSHHAITIRSEKGIDVLMHIGLDTVNLKGEGFHLKTEEGKEVEKGDPLISFDINYISQRAKSILTEIIVSSPDKDLKIEGMTSKRVTVGEDIIFSVAIKEKEVISDTNSTKEITSWEITVTNPTGFHARPAALLASEAKKFKSDIRLILGDKTANAKSVVSIMGLNIGYKDRIKLQATGEDSEEALFVLIPLIEAGLGEGGGEGKEEGKIENKGKEVSKTREVTGLKVSEDFSGTIKGIGSSDGIAVGFIHHFYESSKTYSDDSSNFEEEKARLDKALIEADKQLEAVYQDMKKKTKANEAEIFLAHKELLADPELKETAYNLIKEGRSAEYAWDRVTKEQADNLTRLNNDLLAGRATDLRDINKRVVNILIGKEEGTSLIPDNSIIVAEEITPSETASLEKDKISGICTTHGGSTSHVSILARTLGIPAITGAGEEVLKIPEGTKAIINGTSGFLIVNPSQEEVIKMSKLQAEEKKHYEENLADANKPAITTDGKRIEVGGNIGNLTDVKEVLRLGGEGIGLLRSEFLFLNREEAPTEEEQATVYKDIAQAVGKDRKLIIRTLDVGGDKNLSYLEMAKEENPFLGVRGIRLSLSKPELFRTQIRGILRAVSFSDLHIMFPMISRIKEFEEAKAIVEEEKSLLKEGLSVKIGIMVEVPSAAIMIEEFAEIADFFSLGTNDLTQYTLAMDRGNPALSSISDSFHPAVLRLIQKTVNGAHKYGRFVGVCGGMAGDLRAVPILVGLGVDELSVAAPLIPKVKQRIRELNFKDMANLSGELLELHTASSIKEKLDKVFKDF